MVTSMTGYGRDEIIINETNIAVEIRSVNHRFLDVSMKMPRSLLVLEEKLKKVVQSFFQRGRIEVFVTMNGEELISRTLLVNWDLMDQYIEKIQEAKSRYNLNGNIPVDVLTKIEDVFSVQEQSEYDETVYHSVEKVLTTACRQVEQMRQEEGREIKKDLAGRIDFIEKTVKELGERRDIVIIEYRDRIIQRIKTYIEDESYVTDESKLYQDIAVLAEKGDITEEVTRLHSHVHQFLQTMSQKDAIGRKLDFILQEMHRETNTIGSKSNDVKNSELVVLLKSEIEKIKEQIQNVE
ncbi:YicC family protein [Aquibacillus koreensis]|uniref:YicC family protein n=1 Tax=Aquibacillus koreensis TaxID=279446 RepID=A0A9X4AHX0_9BACI|nr:YicC/YloC family endoribonuclease [Aquibacillus koreensis]MCT2538024.1 YicC family protein [Aquibacillus koreensis]MDC3420547.1 YicC family protein [Aquibacillus koreensis]